MKQTKLRTLILAAMFAALTCVATMIIHIPSPIGGYFNLGDCMVLLSAFVLGPVWGTAAGGIGSALADVICGYFIYAPGTLVIKALMALGRRPDLLCLRKERQPVRQDLLRFSARLRRSGDHHGRRLFPV